MDLKEIIALAKAGYKKKDIEELLKVSTDTSQSEDIYSVPPEVKEEASDETQELPIPKEEPNPLIEEQKKQIQKLTEELKKAQESAVRTDISKDELSEDVLADIFRKFM